ncbi:MAG: hypothetical protein QW295_00260, partial [Thermoplasmata archaeon]
FTQSEKSEPYNQYDTEESTNEEEEWVYNQYDTEESTNEEEEWVYNQYGTEESANEEEEWVYNQYGTEESTNEEKGGTYNQYVAENVIYTLQRSDWEIILYMVLIGVEFLFLAVYIRPAVLLFYPIALFYIFHKTNIWQTEKRFKMGTIVIVIVSLIFIISIAFYSISLYKIASIIIYSFVNEISFCFIIVWAESIRKFIKNVSIPEFFFKYTLQRSDWRIILYLVLIGVGLLFLVFYFPFAPLFYPIIMFYIFHKTNIWQTEKRFKMGTIAIGIYSLTLFIISLIASNIIESIIKALGLFIMNEIFFVIIIYVANEIRRGR